MDGRRNEHIPLETYQYKCNACVFIIYYIKLQFPFVCLSVCLYLPPFFDTTAGPQPNLEHIFGYIWDSFSATPGESRGGF